MKAIVVDAFGDPDVLQLREIPDPAPGAGQVLVKLHAAGVNPVDAYIRTGTYHRKPPLPWTPGFDGAGVVEQIGSGVTEFAIGDRVYVATLGSWSGTYAERVVCDATHVHPLPRDVSFARGAALGVPAATAYRALFGKGNAQRGETVLVHGASGAVGVPCVQLARAAGLTVIGTAGSDRGMEVARQAGCHHVFSHRDPGRADAVREVTGGRGVDLIVEMLASANLDLDLQLLAPRGRIVVVGSRGRIEIDPRFTMAKDAAILGMTLWNVPPDESARIHLALVEALRSGTLRPIVGREMPLAEAALAHRALFESSAEGKIVLVP
ncbi:MAG TPA: NADPH:quinone reductase [Vicinamibacterales bacterium]|nr:NADPH:quinone reductase [Vicinamibacterales bacterium]